MGRFLPIGADAESGQIGSGGLCPGCISRSDRTTIRMCSRDGAWFARSRERSRFSHGDSYHGRFRLASCGYEQIAQIILAREQLASARRPNGAAGTVCEMQSTETGRFERLRRNYTLILVGLIIR